MRERFLERLKSSLIEPAQNIDGGRFEHAADLVKLPDVGGVHGGDDPALVGRVPHEPHYGQQPDRLACGIAGHRALVCHVHLAER